ncbi:MAG: hypothetical protein IPO78_10080 [Saprospiraceae bacterium]|nr:hypothetical protein [Saprospiraceae bacterium]MBK8451658.1 hypothetical protein [Saprospiraceae bacterium]MBK9721947.1 hypothetical protein [Saprospiraceae bacterium]
MWKKVEELKQGDIVNVDLSEHGKLPHLALVLNTAGLPRGTRGQDKWVVQVYTITHEPVEKPCKVEIPCHVIPISWFGKSCSDNQSHSYLKTDNPIYLKPGEIVEYRDNIWHYTPLIEEICTQVYDCDSTQRGKLGKICNCEKIEAVGACITPCDCNQDDGDDTGIFTDKYTTDHTDVPI